MRGRLKWISIFLCWNLAALFFAVQVAYQTAYGGRPFPLWLAYIQEAIYCYIWFALTPAILWISIHYPVERQKWLRSVLVHSGAGVVFSLLHLLVALLCILLFPFASWIPPGKTFFEAYRIQVINFFQLNLFFYWGTIGIIFAFNYYRMYRERELRASQLEARLAQSNLQVLMMQLHPHFLFNTLHTISSTMHRDLEAADDMITHLSDLLRITLENVGMQEVSLKQELGLLERYLQIEKARFRERLEVRMQIDPATLDARVPNLLLQPLVENAIRHGIALYSTAGLIEIRSSRADGILNLEVRDNGRGISGDKQGELKEGVGLSNTQARLQQLYGAEHRFGLSNLPEGGLVVSINIPFRESDGKFDGADQNIGSR